MKLINLLAAAMAAMALSGRAATYYVAPGGNDGNDGSGWGANALATIGAGVAKATANGDTVLVSNGTYTRGAEILVSTGITVRSWNDGNLDPAGTVVDGDYQTRCFRLTHADALLAGFTVLHGTNAASGGGVFVMGGGTVTQCVLSANSAREGGGLCITNGGLVTHSTLSGNAAVSNSATVATRGGGVILWQYGVVSNCVVADNTVAGRSSSGSGRYSGGGGIALDVGATNHELRVYGTLVSNNISAHHGGGILFRQNDGGFTQVVISGSTVADNTAGVGGNGGGIYLSSQYYSTRMAGAVTGCLVQGNYAPGYTGLGGGGIFQRMLVRDSTIRGNSTDQYGGGCNSVMIYDSIVESNYTTSYGGGLNYSFGDMEVSNCIVRGNSSADSGNCQAGGIFFYSGGKTVIKDCEIRENVAKGFSAVYGNGILVTGELYNCLICDNVSTSGATDGRGPLGGVFSLSGCTIMSNRCGSTTYGAVWLKACSTVTNCIIYSNLVAGSFGNDVKYDTGADSNLLFYSCIPSGIPEGQGNITEAPKFKDFGNGDYRLAADSPGVNAGTNESWMDAARDLDGVRRIDPFAQRVDMGAFEYLPNGTLFRLR